MNPREAEAQLQHLINRLDALTPIPERSGHIPLRAGYSLYRYNSIMERWDVLGSTRTGDSLAHADWEAVRIPLVPMPPGAPQSWLSGELRDATGPVHSAVYVCAAAVDL